MKEALYQVWQIACLFGAIFLVGVAGGAGFWAGIKLGIRLFGPWRKVVYREDE